MYKQIWAKSKDYFQLRAQWNKDTLIFLIQYQHYSSQPFLTRMNKDGSSYTKTFVEQQTWNVMNKIWEGFEPYCQWTRSISRYFNHNHVFERVAHKITQFPLRAQELALYLVVVVMVFVQWQITTVPLQVWHWLCRYFVLPWYIGTFHFQTSVCLLSCRVRQLTGDMCSWHKCHKSKFSIHTSHQTVPQQRVHISFHGEGVQFSSPWWLWDTWRDGPHLFFLMPYKLCRNSMRWCGVVWPPAKVYCYLDPWLQSPSLLPVAVWFQWPVTKYITKFASSKQLLPSG